jgi:hypothetical protein
MDNRRNIENDGNISKKWHLGHLVDEKPEMENRKTIAAAKNSVKKNIIRRLGSATTEKYERHHEKSSNNEKQTSLSGILE